MMVFPLHPKSKIPIDQGEYEDLNLKSFVDGK